MALTTVAPSFSSATEANWADPAKTVADISTDCQAGTPAVPASTPNDTPNTPTAATTGAAALMRLRSVAAMGGGYLVTTWVSFSGTARSRGSDLSTWTARARARLSLAVL